MAALWLSPSKGCRVTLPAKQITLQVPAKIAWLASKPKRVKIAVGGRGSAKSTGVGDVMVAKANAGKRICCAREFQNSIDDSVHENLKIEIERLGLSDQFTVMATEIHAKAGGEIFYKGLARNITSLKSLAGVDILWIEEGESVSKRSLKVLTPSIRSSAASNVSELHSAPEIWITMNRGSSLDAVAQKYLKRAEKSLAKTGYYEDDLMMVVQMNYDENPWFPPELEQERLDDYANLSRAECDHIWMGAYGDSVPNALIKAEWFDACIDAHLKLGFKPLGAKVAAYDPSDEGKDDKGYALRHGSVVIDVQAMDHGDVAEGTDWALDRAITQGADWFTWDADGMGLALKRQVDTALAGKHMDYVPFRGSEKADDPKAQFDDVTSRGEGKSKTNEEALFNTRAQYYVRLMNRCYRTYRAVVHGEYANPDELISFSSEIECLPQLRAEVCRIPVKPNGSGRIQILSKPEMARKPYELPSPNLSDVVMMSLLNPVAVKTVTKINFQGWGG